MDGAKLHHVVFCLQPENLDRAAAYWRELGMNFNEVPLVEEGLRVLLDWTGGIELLSPAKAEGTETARFRAFLDEHGEGVYSVVVRTPDIDAPIAVAGRHQAFVRYQQHRENGDFVVDEADLTPTFGMAITLLSTNLPE